MFCKVSFQTEGDWARPATGFFLLPTPSPSQGGRSPESSKKFQSSPTCKSPGLISGDGPEVAQVTLVAHEHDDNVAVGVIPQLLQPPLHVLIGEVLGDVIHQQCPHGSTVVPGDRGQHCKVTGSCAIVGNSSGSASHANKAQGNSPGLWDRTRGRGAARQGYTNRASSESGSKASPVSVGKTCIPDMKPHVCGKLLSPSTSDPLLKTLPHPPLWVQHRQGWSDKETAE